ncbi:MAG: choice-of-anchor D domain-containing protein [Acidobacteriia bacterium]|nr:choice-of-anchor D domain-containing protein [Terriglobia bacterium]
MTVVLLLGTFLLAAAASAQVSYKISPASLSVSASAYVGVSSASKPISITNTGTTAFTVTAFSISPSQFQLNYGYAPITLPPGQSANFAIVFVPTASGIVTGQFSMTISGVTDPIVISLTGTGRTTTALPQVTPTSLNFGSLPVGTVSAPQTVTVKNVGKSAVSLTSIATDPPFTLSGAQLVTLKPGQSTSFQVTFTSTATATSGSVLVVQYGAVPASGIDLTGTGIPATSLAVSNYPILPSATQSAAYNANLTAAGAVGNLSWSMAAGSTLPLGLSLSNAGVITGTLDPSIAAGNYPFSVSVTDSNTPPATATVQLTLPVGAPTGSNCNQISWPPATKQPRLIPITDLGTGSYLGAQGGLYPGGSNVRPASHDADGVGIAQGIVPLDGNGNYDPNGKYALLSLGNSVAFDDFVQFITEANSDPMKNSHLVFVPGAQPKAGAADYAVTNSPFWSAIQNYYLPQSGVTANQVVAAWIMDVIAQPTGTFPSDMSGLQTDYEKIAQNLHTFFPNLKLMYFTSRYYGGYSFGVRDPADVEAYAYQSGFAVKWAIQDQLNGLAGLNYNPALGPVMAPWMSWAHYDWANGLLPRNDGLVWTCQDIQADGTHPSNPAGRMKDTNLMMNFFKTDNTTTPWFLAPGAR